MLVAAPVQETDKLILRVLLEEYAEAANLPVQDETRERWLRLNDLSEVRPLVWINEIPWKEMDVNGELAPVCGDPYLRELERGLRRMLYQWRHMRGDMVLDPYLTVQTVCGPTSCYADYGIQAEVERAAARAFRGIIRSDADVARVRKPDVWVDREETARRLEVASEVCEGILPVRERGLVHQWAAPWDVMIQWYGIEQLYTDMYDNPGLIQSLLRRYMEIQDRVLEEQEALGLLDTGDGNYRIGSGGPGITDGLPTPADGEPVGPRHQWGCSSAQILSEVSPEMHWEFSLQYEKPYLERFGLTYYGCCEPLHRKAGILKRVGNLRKISISPFADVQESAEAAGRDYVLSYKPNPAILAGESWDPDLARRRLADDLKAARGCCIEIIMKDITTIRGEPRRLWEWCAVAMAAAHAAG
jgi:hypothetical protein